MHRLRKEDLSLHYYLKDIVLKEFIEHEEYVPLKLLNDMSTNDSMVYEALTEMTPSPIAHGRGWVYFDDNFESTLTSISGTIEQEYRVQVFNMVTTLGEDVFNIIPDTDYIIDYEDGRIIYFGYDNPTHVSYFWNYIGVVDEWRMVLSSNAPVVVVDLYETSKGGFQLGGGKLSNRKVDLHIFASNAAERNDIVEVLYDGLYLKSCLNYDFSFGTVLDYDGTFNNRKNNTNKLTTPFNRSTVSGVSNLQFENVVSRNVNLPLIMSGDQLMLDDLNAYRSKISFDLLCYVEP